MKKIYFFEACLDEMGGVERVISTLANSFINEYDVETISLYKTRKESFFKYNEKVKRTYLQNALKSNKYKKGSIIYLFYKVLEKLYRLTILKIKKKIIANKISNEDILVFGRISIAEEFIPKYFGINNKIIVRDASHYYCHNEKEQGNIKELLNNIRLFIVSSDESKDTYDKIVKNHKCEIKKIYNPLGINPIRKYNFNNKTIVAVGRYDFQKGYNVLLKSMSLVIKSYPDWKLEIVGAYNKELCDLISEFNLENNIILTKEIKDIVSKLNESSIYITTSRFEGYANSLVEAVACGIPSISVDWLLGPDEIIKDGYNGRIVKLCDRFKYAQGIDNEKDAENLAETLIKMINNPEKCEEYSHNSEELIKTREKETIINIWKKEIERIN